MNKHTPGPWEVYSKPYEGWKFKGGYLGCITSATGKEVYAGPASFYAIRGDTLEEANANALLMAAAPELFDALRDCIVAMDIARDTISPVTAAQVKLHGLNPQTDKILDEAARKAIQAINKAQGE